MLAVAGTYQVAVIVLPRPSYHKLVNTRVDCKSVSTRMFLNRSLCSILYTGPSKWANITMQFQDRLTSPRSTGIHGVKEGALYSFLPLIQCSGVHQMPTPQSLYSLCS